MKSGLVWLEVAFLALALSDAGWWAGSLTIATASSSGPTGTGTIHTFDIVIKGADATGYAPWALTSALPGALPASASIAVLPGFAQWDSAALAHACEE